MKTIDCILRSYSSTINWPKLLSKLKITSIWRRTLIAFGMLYFPKVFTRNKTALKKERTPEIIVSLTSYPARINKVWLTIESLFLQQMKPDRIILWLSKEQFSRLDNLPAELLAQQKRGLEIRFVDNDYKSHKKYLYVFKEFPNDYIVLIDDDIIYPSDMISRLYKDMTPHSVHCSYGSVIQWHDNGDPMPYREWKGMYENYYGDDFFFGSGGGTMLKPNSLPKETCGIDLALELCPKADDIWLNAMCRRAGLKISKVRSALIYTTNINSEDTLYRENIGLGKNDLQLENINKHFHNVFRKQCDFNKV